MTSTCRLKSVVVITWKVGYGDHGRWRWLDGYAFFDYSTKVCASDYAQGEVSLSLSPPTLNMINFKTRFKVKKHYLLH